MDLDPGETDISDPQGQLFTHGEPDDANKWYEVEKATLRRAYNGMHLQAAMESDMLTNTPEEGPPVCNLRPRPWKTIRGRKIYRANMKIPGEHFIIRQFEACESWGCISAGVIQKVDDDNSSVETTDSLTGTVFQMEAVLGRDKWEELDGTMDEVVLGEQPYRITHFSPTILENTKFPLAPGVREGLTDDFNHCWVPIGPEVPARLRGKIGVAIAYSGTTARILCRDGTTGKVPLTSLRAARPNWPDCAECAEELYIVNDADLCNFSTIGKRVWTDIVPRGSSKIQLEFKDRSQSIYHHSEVTKIEDGWELTSYPVITLPPGGKGRVTYPRPLPAEGYVWRNYIGPFCGHYDGEADPPYPIIQSPYPISASKATSNNNP